MGSKINTYIASVDCHPNNTSDVLLGSDEGYLNELPLGREVCIGGKQGST